MAVDKKWMVKLQGRDYPMYAGILDVATRSGLKSLTTRIVQIPSAENNGMAVVMARAEFEDGRIFEDVGDSSAANTNPKIASAALRMASTRAKGRVLRDATNNGETMFEELPDAEDCEMPRPETQSRPPQVNAPAKVEACEHCGTILTPAEIAAAPNWAEAFENRKLCKDCGKPLIAAYKAAQAA